MYLQCIDILKVLTLYVIKSLNVKIPNLSEILHSVTLQCTGSNTSNKMEGHLMT